MIKTKFLQTCIGISIVTLSLGFLFQSVQNATASPRTITPFQPEIGKFGKYATTVVTNTAGVIYAVTTDTETGQMAVNYYDKQWKRDMFKPVTNAMDGK
jgi:hypothetical protein